MTRQSVCGGYYGTDAGDSALLAVVPLTQAPNRIRRWWPKYQEKPLDHYLPMIPNSDLEIPEMRELNDARCDLKLAMRLRRWRDALYSRDRDEQVFRYQKIIEHVTEQLRQARLDEHQILAALDEEGRKQRYSELAQEGKKGAG